MRGAKQGSIPVKIGPLGLEGARLPEPFVVDEDFLCDSLEECIPFHTGIRRVSVPVRRRHCAGPLRHLRHGHDAGVFQMLRPSF